MPYFVAFFVLSGVAFCNSSRTSFSFNSAGFVQVMENLESHGIEVFQFPGLESHGI